MKKAAGEGNMPHASCEGESHEASVTCSPVEQHMRNCPDRNDEWDEARGDLREGFLRWDRRA